MTQAATLSLGASLTHAAATDLLTDLRAKTGQPLDIDASNVTFLGAQCLQVLIAAAHKWHADETPYNIINPSVDFDACLSRYGVPMTAFTGKAN